MSDVELCSTVRYIYCNYFFSRLGDYKLIVGDPGLGGDWIEPPELTGKSLDMPKIIKSFQDQKKYRKLGLPNDLFKRAKLYNIKSNKNIQILVLIRTILNSNFFSKLTRKKGKILLTKSLNWLKDCFQY